jgi:hypothetical protein
VSKREQQWFKYVHWYHTVAVDPGVFLSAFFKEAPFVSRSCKEGKGKIRILSLCMCPLYDEVANKGL